jgi:hypothetical protein
MYIKTKLNSSRSGRVQLRFNIHGTHDVVPNESGFLPILVDCPNDTRSCRAPYIVWTKLWASQLCVVSGMTVIELLELRLLLSAWSVL